MLELIEAARRRAYQAVNAELVGLYWRLGEYISKKTKATEERHFYILSAIQSRWTSRELERQLRTRAFRRTLAPRRVSAVLAQTHPGAIEELKDIYNLEFLDLHDGHSEADLHRGLLRNLGRFISELGRDSCFVGSEYPVQVGNQDFAIDLSSFCRGLTCRATKDDEVVEYALARTTSPTLVAEYQTMLPPKTVLRRKLHELYAQLSVGDRVDPAQSPTPVAETIAGTRTKSSRAAGRTKTPRRRS